MITRIFVIRLDIVHKFLHLFLTTEFICKIMFNEDSHRTDPTTGRRTSSVMISWISRKMLAAWKSDGTTGPRPIVHFDYFNFDIFESSFSYQWFEMFPTEIHMCQFWKYESHKLMLINHAPAG